MNSFSNALIHLIFILSTLLLASCDNSNTSKVVIGSKIFTESYLLAEIAAQTVEAKTEFKVQRRFGIGGTSLLLQALENGRIDVYPEYTGTLREMLLNAEGSKTQSLEEALKERGIAMSPSLGFNNSYALAVRRNVAEKLKIKRISDLQKHQLRAGLSHEFANRKDGYLGLKSIYDLENKLSVIPMQHTLSYQAISDGSVDIIDVYTTDAKVNDLGLVILEDDLRFFPSYEAVFLTTVDFVKRHPLEWSALISLSDTITAKAITKLNSRLENRHEALRDVVEDYFGVKKTNSFISKNRFGDIWLRTYEHLLLVAVTIFFAVLIGTPLGVFAFRYQKLAHIIVSTSSVVQTIPSLALLGFLIPLFGVGNLPALVALSLYSILPVVIGTLTGLQSIDPKIIEVAKAIGLNRSNRLWRILLPIAAPTILSGVKTATVFAIGTATLAALIGAGGYGVPIVTGLATNDTAMILEGAIPASFMALIVLAIFAIVERQLQKKGLMR